MKKKLSFIFFSVLLWGNIILNAQVFIEMGSPVNPRDAFGSINVYGSDGLLKSIPYSRIKGSPFLNDQWNPGVLYDSRDSILAKCPVKINLATQEIHFLNLKGEEMVPVKGVVRKVVIYDAGDSTKVLTSFNNNIPEIRMQTKNKDYYVQQLNIGKVQLLKIILRKVESADSLFGTQKRYFFADQAEYYLLVNNKVERIKRLNKEEFFVFLPEASKYNLWIREKKLKFRNEEDFIVFLDHYNNSSK